MTLSSFNDMCFEIVQYTKYSCGHLVRVRQEWVRASEVQKRVRNLWTDLEC